MRQKLLKKEGVTEITRDLDSYEFLFKEKRKLLNHLRKKKTFRQKIDRILNRF